LSAVRLDQVAHLERGFAHATSLGIEARRSSHRAGSPGRGSHPGTSRRVTLFALRVGKASRQDLP
jgi:hypothetical protein